MLRKGVAICVGVSELANYCGRDSRYTNTYTRNDTYKSCIHITYITKENRTGHDLSGISRDTSQPIRTQYLIGSHTGSQLGYL